MTRQITGGGDQPPLFFAPPAERPAKCGAETICPDANCPNADWYYQPNAGVLSCADRWFDQLRVALPWQQHPIKMFGRCVLQPRLSAWFGDAEAVYTYSHTRHEPLPWCEPLIEIRHWLEQHCAARFNAVLANCYRDGGDYMGWHSDDEPELGDRPVIASLSLGVTRRFVFRYRQQKMLKQTMMLEHGSLLVMAGRTQQFWQHALPKMVGVKAPRINLTFRQIQIKEGPPSGP